MTKLYVAIQSFKKLFVSNSFKKLYVYSSFLKLYATTTEPMEGGFDYEFDFEL